MTDSSIFFSFLDGILGHSWRNNGRCELHPTYLTASFNARNAITQIRWLTLAFFFPDGILGHSWRNNGRCQLHPTCTDAWFVLRGGCGYVFPPNWRIFECNFLFNLHYYIFLIIHFLIIIFQDWFTRWNFLIHNVAIHKSFSAQKDSSSGELLSFIPKSYS